MLCCFYYLGAVTSQFGVAMRLLVKIGVELTPTVRDLFLGNRTLVDLAQEELDAENNVLITHSTQCVLIGVYQNQHDPMITPYSATASTYISPDALEYKLGGFSCHNAVCRSEEIAVVPDTIGIGSSTVKDSVNSRIIEILTALHASLSGKTERILVDIPHDNAHHVLVCHPTNDP